MGKAGCTTTGQGTYNPSVGRFLSEDPIGFSGGLNLYQYVNNNPVTFVDPRGLDGFVAGLVEILLKPFEILFHGLCALDPLCTFNEAVCGREEEFTEGIMEATSGLPEERVETCQIMNPNLTRRECQQQVAEELEKERKEQLAK
jgi:hypothetical protein